MVRERWWRESLKITPGKLVLPWRKHKADVEWGEAWPKESLRMYPSLCLLCPSLAQTAKLFLTASKHVLTSCSHDTLGLFAFSVNSWLTLCQLEIVLPRKLSMTQTQNSLSPFPSHISAQPVLWQPTRPRGLLCSSSAMEAYWVLLRSLSGSELFPSLNSLILGQSVGISNPKYLLCACRS